MTNLFRNKGRNILLGAILSAMVALTGIAWILNAGTKQITQEYKKQFGSKVTLISSMNAQKIPSDVLLSFQKSTHLQKSEYLAKASITMEKLKAVGEQDDAQVEIPKGYLIASSQKEINDDFRTKTKLIVKGKMYSQPNEIIISQAFAKLNHLDIHDTITLRGKDYSKQTASTYVITGIYDIVSLGQKENEIPLLNPANEIYTSYDSFLKSSIYQKFGDLSATFYLKDPKHLSAFQQEIKDKGLPENYQAVADEKSYQKAVQPLESIHDIASMFAIGVLALGTLILLLLTMFFIRERTYEIGVLRAMGLKKQGVAVVLIVETMLLCVISLLVGLLLAQLGGSFAGSLMLQDQMDIAKNLAIANNLDAVSFTIHSTTVATLICISLAVGCMSSMMSMITILHYEPRKILSERN